MKTLAKAVGGGSTKTVKVAPLPEPAPAAPMPDEQDLKRAAAREELTRRKNTGRYSTLLSDDDDGKL